MLGHQGLAKWGSPQWGDQFLKPIASVLVDGVAKRQTDQPFSVDNVAQAFGLEAAFAVDNLAELEADASFSVDVYQMRLPVAAFRDTVTFPILLVSIQLWSGTIYVANRDLVWGGQAYDGRLVVSGTILRTLTSGTDDVQLVLDDTETRGARFRDLFQQEDPEGALVTVWMVLEGQPKSTRLLVFEGRLERIAGFTEATCTIDAVRLEAVQDQVMGRLLNDTDFPNAPEESLSQTIPIVFGLVETHRGLVIDTNAVGKLDQALDLPQQSPWVLPTTVQVIGPYGQIATPPGGVTTPGGLLQQAVVLQSAADFPVAGVVQIGTERIAYTWKQGDSLMNITRGVQGTIPTPHGSGAQVLQVGTFSVKFADHALPIIENIRLRTRDDYLGEPVPQPASIVNSSGLVVWNEQPRIRSAEEEPQFHRVHFYKEGDENLAAGALYCARESGWYRAFGVAQLGTALRRALAD